MVYFVGAGSGAADLITVRGKNLLEKADVIIYAGSLVNPELLTYAKEDCEIHNSAYMTLDEVITVMENAEKGRKDGLSDCIRRAKYIWQQCGSRWIFWMKKGSLMKAAPG